MDIGKPATVASIGATPATPGPTGRGIPGQAAEPDSGSPKGTNAVVDRVDIGPLSLPGALQILLAEVREALAAQMPVLPLPPANQNPPQTPDQAAHQLVEWYLQAASLDEGKAPVEEDWLARLARIDAGVTAGFERALQVVSAWREVTPAVIASLHEARSLAASALATDEAIAGEDAAAGEIGSLLTLTGLRDAFNPAWLVRPEWLRLAPRLDRFRRLRRKLRRSGRDPDARDPTLPFV